jgi:hypothetical protein
MDTQRPDFPYLLARQLMATLVPHVAFQEDARDSARPYGHEATLIGMECGIVPSLGEVGNPEPRTTNSYEIIVLPDERR